MFVERSRSVAFEIKQSCLPEVLAQLEIGSVIPESRINKIKPSNFPRLTAIFETIEALKTLEIIATSETSLSSRQLFRLAFILNR